MFILQISLHVLQNIFGICSGHIYELMQISLIYIRSIFKIIVVPMTLRRYYENSYKYVDF